MLSVASAASKCFLDTRSPAFPTPPCQSHILWNEKWQIGISKGNAENECENILLIFCNLQEKWF